VIFCVFVILCACVYMILCMCACLFVWVSVCTRVSIYIVEEDLFQNAEQEVSILRDKNIH
jgi:hypothetical protein